MALTDFLTSIADAIRYAEGSSGEINAQQFATRIRALSGTTKTLSSISATKTTTSYTVEDTISTSDITVTATYSDSTTSTVSGWTTNADSIDMSTSGTKTLTVSYTENSVTKTSDISITVAEPTPLSVVDVGIGDDYTYHTIKSAESVVADGGTIQIHEGTYDEYGIGKVDKAITYLGVNKDTCIVQNGLSDKQYSVFDLQNANKTVKNLTIHQTHSNPQNPTIDSVAYKAYGVHCDTSNCAGHNYTIENCIIKNKYFCAVGFGLWQNHKITVKDCSLDLYDTNRDLTLSGAYYCHCNTTTSGVTGQSISLIGNTIHAYQSKAIRIDEASQDGSEMVCEFINNTCNSDLYGTEASCVDFSTNDHTTLADTSSGNNISILNYGTPSTYTAPDGLTDTGYWVVVYNRTLDKYMCGNTNKVLSRGYKTASELLSFSTTVSNATLNSWVSDDGQTWTKVVDNYNPYSGTTVATTSSKGFKWGCAYQNVIELVDAWSDTEFSWEYA